MSSEEESPPPSPEWKLGDRADAQSFVRGKAKAKPKAKAKVNGKRKAGECSYAREMEVEQEVPTNPLHAFDVARASLTDFLEDYESQAQQIKDLKGQV